MTWRTEGADDLQMIGARLRGADKKLRTQVAASIRKAAKPAGREILEDAARDMPRHGGFAERLASRKYGIRSSLTGSRASVWIAFKPGGKGLAALDKGRLRHPVFGNRRNWAEQAVPVGRLSAALQRRGPAVQKEVIRGANEVFDEIARGL